MSEATHAERRASRESRRVGGHDARSWQLVNALRAEEFDAAELGRADQIILDIEDAVDGSRKDEARTNVLDWFAGGGRAWVRINDVTTDDWERDLVALTGVEGVRGVMLAKAESPAQVTDTFHRLGGRTPVIPLIESALGIEDAVSIARAPGAYRLAFGSGDYRRDTGAESNALAMAYPRTKLVLASRIGNLPGPIDGPTPYGVHAVLREAAADAVAMGMTGKLCLDLDHPAVINESMAPTPSDVAWAIEFLAEFEANGRIIRDGSDKPRLGRAEKIVERAEVFGIQPS
jgi:citrate lyase subunit beta/citryl-CoA lyase